MDYKGKLRPKSNIFDPKTTVTYNNSIYKTSPYLVAQFEESGTTFK